MNKESQNRELDIQELNQELQHKLETLNDEQDENKQKKGKEGHHRPRKTRTKKSRKKKVTLFRVVVTILCVLIFLIASAVGIFLFLRMQGKKELGTEKNQASITVPEGTVIEDDGKYVVYKGEKYCYNENVISILCMGIDTSIQETNEDSLGENGQADALILAVLDSQTGDLALVNISRDSMVDVNKYNVKGQYLGTEKMQICLSYAYGDGKEKSCLNTIESVSRLMYGMPIHAYAAIDYDGISVLNDAVGGVTVQVLEDLTIVDPELTAGKTVTLDGQQAHSYVRARNVELLDSNNMRMARQKQYMLAFLQKFLSETRSDINVPLTLYQAAGDYMVTNVGSAEISYLASLILEKGISEGAVYSVPGEVVKGETYAEFIPDDQGLYELILNVFYTKVNE